MISMPAMQVLWVLDTITHIKCKVSHLYHWHWLLLQSYNLLRFLLTINIHIFMFIYLGCCFSSVSEMEELWLKTVCISVCWSIHYLSLWPISSFKTSISVFSFSPSLSDNILIFYPPLLWILSAHRWFSIVTVRTAFCPLHQAFISTCPYSPFPAPN